MGRGGRITPRALTTPGRSILEVFFYGPGSWSTEREVPSESCQTGQRVTRTHPTKRVRQLSVRLRGDNSVCSL